MAANNPQPSNWQTAKDAVPDPDAVKNAEKTNHGPQRPVNERLRHEAELLQRTAKSYGRPPASAVPDKSQSPASLWPTQLVTPHPEDEIRNIQRTLVGDTGVVPGVGMAIADSDYFKYQKEKADQIELAKFKAFVLERMDLSSPEKVAYYEQHFPEVFEDRRRLLEQQFDIAKKAALISLYGPKNMEDLMFIYLVQTGKIELPTGDIINPRSHPRVAFNRGLFNIKNLYPVDKIYGSDYRYPFKETGPAHEKDTKWGLFGDENSSFQKQGNTALWDTTDNKTKQFGIWPRS
jgi:hypothetical protein